MDSSHHGFQHIWFLCILEKWTCFGRECDLSIIVYLKWNWFRWWAECWGTLLARIYANDVLSSKYAWVGFLRILSFTQAALSANVIMFFWVDSWSATVAGTSLKYCHHFILCEHITIFTGECHSGQTVCSCLHYCKFRKCRPSVAFGF